MKHSLSIILILALLSNHLSSKTSCWSYTKVKFREKLQYFRRSPDINTNHFYKIADVLKAESIFDKYSFNEDEKELNLKCEDKFFFPKSLHTPINKAKSPEQVAIEKCFHHMTGCSPTKLDCYLKAFVEEDKNISVFKRLSFEHKLTINSFNEDKNSISLHPHVKLAVLISSDDDDQNYSVLTKNGILNSEKFSKLELNPILYIIYEADKEEGRLTKNDKTKSNHELLKEYFLKPEDFKVSNDYIFYYGNNSSELNNFDKFNRFFGFRKVNTNLSLIKDYEKLIPIYSFSSTYLEVIEELREVFNRNIMPDSNWFLLFAKFQDVMDKIFDAKKIIVYRDFKKVILSDFAGADPEVIETGRSILLEVDEFLEKVKNTHVKIVEAKEIIDRGSKISPALTMIKDRLKLNFLSILEEVITKYDF